jgi:hypothetical protein
VRSEIKRCRRVKKFLENESWHMKNEKCVD